MPTSPLTLADIPDDYHYPSKQYTDRYFFGENIQILFKIPTLVRTSWQSYFARLEDKTYVLTIFEKPFDNATKGLKKRLKPVIKKINKDIKKVNKKTENAVTVVRYVNTPVQRKLHHQQSDSSRIISDAIYCGVLSHEFAFYEYESVHENIETIHHWDMDQRQLFCMRIASLFTATDKIFGNFLVCNNICENLIFMSQERHDYRAPLYVSGVGMVIIYNAMLGYEKVEQHDSSNFKHLMNNIMKE